MNAGRPTLSIGQVLAALKGDFPDVSVSKIRFLETEGLVSPERTASGYRKFSEEDDDRLRTILRLQRDAFMPLKVIRERLAAGDTTIESAVPAATPAPAQPAAASTIAPQPPAPPPPSLAVVPEPADELAEPEPLQLTEADLANESGLELAQIKQLREYGVLCDHQDQGALYFDADDLVVGRLARELLRLGLDARQLKSLRRSAEQEAGTYEQLVTPVLRNRRPEVRAQAADTIRDIARLSREMRDTFLRRALRAVLNGDR